MYGLIGSFTAHPGKRDELIDLMTASAGGMPGCLSYVVARDPGDPDKVWVTEVWDDEASHKASLQIPAVAETIKKAMPLIAGFGDRRVTESVGGVGL
ncbi:MAG: Antibiotic biosynthesis monooxygenase [Caulobacteraceae bacterium]|nr:Antibiotic biosynthesis monooxygenase [Caulobacteraceae bacterium]